MTDLSKVAAVAVITIVVAVTLCKVMDRPWIPIRGEAKIWIIRRAEAVSTVTVQRGVNLALRDIFLGSSHLRQRIVLAGAARRKHRKRD
jgi:hypothetical protein